MEGQSELADLSFLTLLEEEFKDSVVLETLLETFGSAASEGVEEVVVDVVDLEVLEGVVVELHGDLAVVALEVGHLGGDVVAVSGVPAEGYSHGFLALTLEIDWGCVEVVDSVGESVVNQVVDVLLVDDVFPVGVLFHRETHAAVAQKGDFVPVAGILPQLHLAGLKGIFAVLSGGS